MNCCTNLNLIANSGLFLTRIKDKWVQEMPIHTRYIVMYLFYLLFTANCESIHSFSPPRPPVGSLHFLTHSFPVLIYSQEDIQGSMVMYLYQKKADLCP